MSYLFANLDVSAIAAGAGFLNKLAKFAEDGSFQQASIVISSTQGGILMRTTGRDYQAQTFVPGEIISNGDLMVLAKPLADFLAPLLGNEEKVTLFADESHLNIELPERKQVNRQIPIYSDFVVPDSWPVDEDIVWAKVTLDFTSNLKFVASAASDDVQRSIHGVHIHPEGMISSDGRYLARVKYDLGEIKPFSVESDISKLLPDPKLYGEGDIMIGSTDNLFVFKFGTSELTGRLIGTDFPLEQTMNMLAPYKLDNLDHEGAVKIEIDPDGFNFAMDVVSATKNSPFDIVMILASGIITVENQDDPSNNYRGQIEGFETNMEKPIALTFEGLSKLSKLVSFKGNDKVQFFLHPEKPSDFIVLAEKGERLFGSMPRRIQQ